GSRDAVAVVQRREWHFTFGTIQMLLREAIVLHLDQLLEYSSTTKGPQASIDMLIDWLPAEHAKQRRLLKARLKALRTRCESVSITRNRDGAHRDLAVALGKES